MDWAMETHRVALVAVYLLPASRVIDSCDLEKALPVIHEQLAKAAVQLAGVLNQALGQTGRRPTVNGSNLRPRLDRAALKEAVASELWPRN
jgi:hypothetical protein